MRAEPLKKLSVVLGLCVAATGLWAQQQNVTPHQWIALFAPRGQNYHGDWQWLVNSDGSVSHYTPGHGDETQTASGLADVVALVSTNFHLLALTKDGHVFGIGDNDEGQLGNPQFKKPQSTDPIEVQISDVVSISAESYSSYAVKSDGTVWVWGRAAGDFADERRLSGAAATDKHRTPTQVPGIEHAKMISGRLVLLEDGTVWTWDKRPERTTVGNARVRQIEGIHDAVMVNAWESGGFALLKNGAIMAWGANTKGQLGTGATTSAQLDKQSETPVQVKNIVHAVDVDCTRATCFALEKDGTVKAWGWGAIGGMGSGAPGRNDANPLPKVVPIPKNVAAIHGSTSGGQALLTDGTVMAWGADSVATGVYHQSWKPVKETIRK